MIVYHYTQLKDFFLFPIEIKNSDELYWCKPHGGLWCSPVGCSFGWEDCSAGEQFIQEEMTKIELKLEGEFIIIDTYEDLNKLPWNRIKNYMSLNIEFIDFEKIVKDGVDAIYLTEKGEGQTRLPYRLDLPGLVGRNFRNLYGWDCESVLILNERCIKDWKKVDYDITKDLLEKRRKRMDNIDKIFEELLKERGDNEKSIL